MCKISRNSEAGKKIALLKLHPDFKSRQKTTPHDCSEHQKQVGQVKTNQDFDDILACNVCGMPLNSDGYQDPMCGPTGRVQRALLKGQTATVILSQKGLALGFMDGVFDPRNILETAEETI